MIWPKIAPAGVVIVYFACFALGWALLAMLLFGASGSDVAPGSLRGAAATRDAIVRMLALAIHAAVVVVLAWKAQRSFFAHGPLAVVFCFLPLLVLLRHLWLVPAFLYLIAVLHVWLASRRESLGRLQTTRRLETSV